MTKCPLMTNTDHDPIEGDSAEQTAFGGWHVGGEGGPAPQAAETLGELRAGPHPDSDGSSGDTPEGPRHGRLTRKIKSLNHFVDKKIACLNPVAALLWVILLRHAYDGIVEISHARLAKILGMSPRTVIRNLNKLESERLLRRLKIGGKGRGVNRYNLGRGLPLTDE